ncbi:golvesin C-terminal-like domain-containing protein [Bacteroides fluxus]|uniref:Fibronectin type III domain protein n=1 Tax=Bacteroides fluxus YIT 12057 TaxID=763034 RepID=F3PPU3_9BACE|nr:xanthan lyase [Bacteroides fluxus]EGF58985.1 fibronectin type III domain protein [Bacteroides fluxus YIT 12057]
MKKLYSALLSLLIGTATLTAQEVEQNVEERLENFFNEYTTNTVDIGTCKLDSFHIDFRKKKLSVYVNERFAYQPFRQENVDAIYRHLGQILPGPVNYFGITLFAGGRSIDELIPNLYRRGKKDKDRLFDNLENKGAPWVTCVSRPYEITRGLEGRHIALWQSHGQYYINNHDKWGWQRPRLFCTSEDQFTQSFLLPYLIPMLENAGANVFTPRERDTQKQEVIVDNDGTLSGKGGKGSLYLDVKSRKARWEQTGLPGFAQRKRVYQDGENPFLTGTARFAKTEKKKDKAFAEWVPDIPETGEYAVYVSYQTLPNSVSDAKYLVFHAGGVTEFKVNQRIGGGTWVYLGTFTFDKGKNDYSMVILSNESKEKGVVCADAVRFGGGMGNIARGGKTSGLPRYLEGARYSAQWAGMPYSVYGGYEGKNDMNDDINVRSRTVNYLAGKSVFNPAEDGLGVPFEMSMALHSDAGFSKEDAIIGSLGIYTTDFNDGRLNAGTDRYASRDLSDILLTQLQQDIRATFNIDWTRRSMWDRNYSETRLPAVPSTIVELLSHQNFADMRLGHDPNFKFTVGRALYKAILRYICNQHGKDYTVQPLPVSHFALRFGKKNTLELSWEGEDDPLEPTAKPREYIVYTRIGHGGFDNGVRVSSPSHTVKIEPGIVYSFKVTAINRGGESFPSEILAAYKAKHEQGRVLIVNGFDRISGPAVIDTPQAAGFDLAQDPGVPYLYDISLCGSQQNFNRKAAGRQLGDSGNEYEGMKIAGNTFDYPFIHGKAIQATGKYSFVSCSDEALESGTISPEDYPIMDYILGLEKTDNSSNPSRNIYYKTFSSPMQRVLTAYCLSGGNLLVSGAYVGSDMSTSQGDREFTRNLLKYGYGNSLQTTGNDIRVQGLGRTFSIPRLPNEQAYPVTAPDCILPVPPAFPVMTYSTGNVSAATAYQGKDYRTFVMGFPFESIEEEADRNAIMASILQFLGERKK